MSVMKRMRDITAATLNDMLEKSEDPVRLIDHYLAAQCEQIIQSEKLYQQLANHTHNLRKQYFQAEELKVKREEQAVLALKAGEEQVARLALQDKVTQEDKSGQ
jgi:phage shock protein A